MMNAVAMRTAIMNYLALFDAMAQGDEVSPIALATRRHLLREAVENDDAREVIVLLEENLLLYRAARVVLKPKPAEVAAVLAERFGHTVEREYIVGRVWGVRDLTDSGRCLDQHIMRLRRALRPIGLDIHNVHRRGFRLDVA
jgi:DNA-binding winged helix-turn-helix (wHTH) protein